MFDVDKEEEIEFHCHITSFMRFSYHVLAPLVIQSS